MLSKIIYLKYGELTLKGKNRVNFINLLYQNIRNALKDIKNIEIKKSFDNCVVKCDEQDVEKTITILKRIPGIYQIIEAYFTCELDMPKVGSIIVNKITQKINDEKIKTFKVYTKRHDKKYPINSMEYSRQIGGIVLKEFPFLKVVMEQPQLAINIEVKEDGTIFYFDKILGTGGFPVGINHKALMLISGGIDSPVAASLLLKKGMKVDFVTFMTPPHTSDEALNKVIELVKRVTLDYRLHNPRLFVVNFTYIQHELAHMSNKSYQITLMRRYFYRIANYLAKKYNYSAIATGESIGQVASQTLGSMKTIESVLDNDLLVFRPLLTFDKLEIIEIAEQINTYEVSILPYNDCCSLFVPKSPTTNPSIKIAEAIEKELDFINEIFNDTLNKYIKIIDYTMNK